MSDTEAKARVRAAKEKLRQVRNGPPPHDDGPSRWWYERYTPFICDFMCDELGDHELLEMEVTFTALHELVAHGFATWLSKEGISDAAAWARFDVRQHLAFVGIFTLLPPQRDVIEFVPLFVRFLGYLQRRGAMSEADARRIASAYEEAAKELEAIDAQLEEEWIVTPLSAPGKATRHLIMPMPWASPESRRRVQKTSYLVDRFTRSREGKALDPGMASYAVHVLVGKHVEKHGHRAWGTLDVREAVEGLFTGIGSPGAEEHVFAVWPCFLAWLARRGWLSQTERASLEAQIQAARRELAGAGALAS